MAPGICTGFPFGFTQTNLISASEIISDCLKIICLITKEVLVELITLEEIFKISSNSAGFLYSILQDLTIISTP